METQAPPVSLQESQVQEGQFPGHGGRVGYITILKGHVSLWLKIGACVLLFGFQALARGRGRSFPGLDTSTVNLAALHCTSPPCSLFTEVT